jgi:hypothetical protein
MSITLLTSCVCAAGEVDVEFGLGGVFQRSGGIKDWDNDLNVSKVRMPALGQMNIFPTDRFGFVWGFTTAQDTKYTDQYLLGLKANMPISIIRFSTAAGVGILYTKQFDPNSGSTISSYHPKTIYGEAAIDIQLTSAAYIGVSFFITKANDSGVKIDNINYSGTFQSAFLKLGFITSKF